MSLYVAETQFDTIGVDTEADLKRVEQILLAQKKLTHHKAVILNEAQA